MKEFLQKCPQQQACSRSYLRTMVCPKYILGYVLTLSMFFEDLLTLGTAICSYLRASLTLSLDHPKAEKKSRFWGYRNCCEAFSLDRQNKAIYFTVSPFPTNLKFLIREKGRGRSLFFYHVCSFQQKYVHGERPQTLNHRPTSPLQHACLEADNLSNIFHKCCLCLANEIIHLSLISTLPTK